MIIDRAIGMAGTGLPASAAHAALACVPAAHARCRRSLHLQRVRRQQPPAGLLCRAPLSGEVLCYMYMHLYACHVCVHIYIHTHTRTHTLSLLEFIIYMHAMCVCIYTYTRTHARTLSLY